jgi:hypothetical protein
MVTGNRPDYPSSRQGASRRLGVAEYKLTVTEEEIDETELE